MLCLTYRKPKQNKKVSAKVSYTTHLICSALGYILPVTLQWVLWFLWAEDYRYCIQFLIVEQLYCLLDSVNSSLIGFICCLWTTRQLYNSVHLLIFTVTGNQEGGSAIATSIFLLVQVSFKANRYYVLKITRLRKHLNE